MPANEAAAPVTELTFTRVVKAPRDLVYRAWTEQAHVAKWWGPRDFNNPVCEVDARPGGAINIHMRSPNGRVFPTVGVFREVMPPKRLVFTTALLDGDEGTREGNTLTLECEGPAFGGSANMQRYRDVHEFIDDDHRVLRASVQEADGSWTQFMTTTYTRTA